MTAEDAPVPPVLSAMGITKTFDAVEVLHGVDLHVAEGARHALIGENGAGKSTLLKILCGLVAADGGRVEVNGETLPRGLQAAQAAGLALVHQELSMVPTLTVAENCFLGRFPTRHGVTRRGFMREATAEILSEIGLSCDPDAPVERLSFADRQLVEIARSLLRRPRILALDEPTSALSPSETQRLFDLLHRLNEERRTTILYVSHRMPELYELCSHATVMRDGTVVGQYDLNTTDSDTLVRSMVGRAVDLLRRRKTTTARRSGRPVLGIDHVSGPGVAEASLSVWPGEICGVGGLVGSGRTELARLIVGLERPGSGRIVIDGHSRRLRSVHDAVGAGLAYVPEDRKGSGLALDLSVGTNAVVPSLDALSRAGYLRQRAMRALAQRVVDDSGVVPADPRRTISSLSGGNQQKILLGKWLPNEPRLLVLDEPTRGVDVNAKSEIHQRIGVLAARGVAVLLISSELPELLALCDRVVVMREGHIAGEVAHGELSEEAIIILASGQQSDDWLAR